MKLTLHMAHLPRALLRLTLLLRGGGALPTSPASWTPDAGDLGPAFDCFASGEWSEAFEHLKTLADRGNRDASRIAFMLEAQGPRLFGKSFRVEPAQRERWSQVPTR